MSTLIVIVSSILITFGVYLVVNGLGTLYDHITCLSIGKFTFISIVATVAIEIIVGIILIGVAIYNVVRLL
jgi:hypothetical protein